LLCILQLDYQKQAVKIKEKIVCRMKRLQCHIERPGLMTPTEEKILSFTNRFFIFSIILKQQ